MKILLFGKNGQVGWELHRSLQPLGEVIALGRDEADFSRPESLRVIIQGIAPDIIVNAVAYTAVDKAEQEEELATKINTESVGVLAAEALKGDALLVHYSTDYVFDGTNTAPYLETDKPCPINAYGRTKLAGEMHIQSSGCKHLIFRTSWVYATRGRNFLLTILKLAREREQLNIVADQTGSPTSARLIADITMLCLQQSIKERTTGNFNSALYHLTASGHTSWHGFAKEIIAHAGEALNMEFAVSTINAIQTSEYPVPASRPMNSRLDMSKLENTFDVKVPDWKTVLHLCLAGINQGQ